VIRQRDCDPARALRRRRCATWLSYSSTVFRAHRLRMLSRILTAEEKVMPDQLSLFEAREPTWAARLRSSLKVQVRDRVKAILVEMAQAALRTPPAKQQQEGDADEP
jgi:hypothetical protein